MVNCNVPFRTSPDLVRTLVGSTSMSRFSSSWLMYLATVLALIPVYWLMRPMLGQHWCVSLSSQKIKYAYTAISPALNPRVKISFGRRKNPPCRGFLLQVRLIFFQPAAFPFFKIRFVKPFLCFMRLNFCVGVTPRFQISKRPGLLRSFA